MNFFSDALRKRERAHATDDKSIPASKIEVSWVMGDSIPHPIPTLSLLGSYSVLSFYCKRGLQEAVSSPIVKNFSKRKIILPSGIRIDKMHTFFSAIGQVIP
jgi:hypothetical protein